MGDQAALATAGYGKYDSDRDRTSGLPPACPALVFRTAKQDGHRSTVNRVVRRVDESSRPVRDLLFALGYFRKMVLQERIELSTSPLPRECSTTELLQHLSPSALAAPSAWRVIRRNPCPVQEQNGACSGRFFARAV